MICQLTPKDLIQIYPEIDFLVAEGNVSSRYVIAVHQAFYQFAADQIDGGFILDAGCGTAFGTEILARKAKLAFGIDVKDKLIEYAKKTHINNKVFLGVMDVGDVGFKDASFNAIIADELLEHLPNHKPFLGEAVRLLQPGGLFVCATVNRRHTFGPADNPLNRNHYREYDVTDFRKEMEQYFTDVTILGQGFGEGFQKYMQTPSARLIEWILVKLNMKHRIPPSWRAQVRGLISGVKVNNSKPEEFAVTDKEVENSLYLVAMARKRA